MSGKVEKQSEWGESKWQQLFYGVVVVLGVAPERAIKCPDLV